MDNLKNRYEQLEKEVISKLLINVKSSKTESKHMNTPCIKVSIFDYSELVEVNGNLTFLDNNGLHYSLFSECTLDDLIDLIN